jgi:apolipoprotein D and lipocalin family protein
MEILEPDFDIFAYAGEWHEIARLPNPWEDIPKSKCYHVTANYYVDDRGIELGYLPEIDIVNTCFDEEGRVIEQGEAIGYILDPRYSSALKVQFPEVPVPGDYLVHETDYIHYSLVGSPRREYAWILSRTPQLCIHVFDGLVERMYQLGYDVDKLVIQPDSLKECDLEDLMFEDLPRDRA